MRQIKSHHCALQHVDFADFYVYEGRLHILTFGRAKTTLKLIVIIKLPFISMVSIRMLLKFNKLIFGSENPSTARVCVLFLIYTLMGLAIYGVPQIFLGPYQRVFIPSEAWRSLSRLATWVISGIMIYITLIKNHEESQRFKERSGEIGIYFTFPLLSLMLYALIYMALLLGTGKAITLMIGKEGTRIYAVVKDKDTHKPVGKHHYTDAYCVTFKCPEVSSLEDSFCLQHVHYNQIPEQKTLNMKFGGRESFFGFVVDGYYWNSSQSP